MRELMMSAGVLYGISEVVVNKDLVNTGTGLLTLANKREFLMVKRLEALWQT